MESLSFRALPLPRQSMMHLATLGDTRSAVVIIIDRARPPLNLSSAHLKSSRGERYACRLQR